MTDHPDRETLKRFVAGEQSSGEARRTDQHLSFCSECRDRADDISTGQALRLLDSWLSPGYDEAFDRAAERVVERLASFAEDPRSTESLLTELLQETASRRHRKIVNDERFHSLKLCQLLQSSSRKAWESSPSTALEMADLAVEVTQYLDAGRYGSVVVEDARAIAWSYLGNAFRIGSDYRRADQALEQAWSHHALAGEDAYTETELLAFTASLRRDQNRYQEAVKLSDRAIALYREGQDSHLEGAALILKGLTLGQDGRSQEAIQLLRSGLDRIDPQRDERLVFAGAHNLIEFISQGGEPEIARKLLEQNRYLRQDLGRLDLARVEWLEGRIAKELGHRAEAKKALHGVREFFLDLQLGTEVVLVSLNLAELYSLSGGHKQTRKLLNETIPLGEALGLSKEVFLARLLYAQASQR
jgi:tetratricopeptide (TPR) repeat protein